MNSPTRRFMLLAPLALSVLCGLMIWSLQLGSVALSWRQTMAALGLSSAPLSGMLDTIVVQLRVPRALLAALTGAGLAMTGALLQTTTRNELADPFVWALLRRLRRRGAGHHALWRCAGRADVAAVRFRRRRFVRDGGDDPVSRQPGQARRAADRLRSGGLVFVQRAHQLPGVFRRSAGGRFGVVLVAGRAGVGALG